MFQEFLRVSTALKQFYGSSASWWRDIKTFYKRYLGLFLILYNFAFMQKVDWRPLNRTFWTLSQEQEEQQQQQKQCRVVLHLLFAGKKLTVFNHIKLSFWVEIIFLVLKILHSKFGKSSSDSLNIFWGCNSNKKKKIIWRNVGTLIQVESSVVLPLRIMQSTLFSSKISSDATFLSGDKTTFSLIFTQKLEMRNFFEWR